MRKTPFFIIILLTLIYRPALADEKELILKAFNQLPKIKALTEGNKNPYPDVRGNILQIKSPEIVSFYGFCGNSYACDLTTLVIQRVVIGYRDGQVTRAEEFPIVGIASLSSDRRSVGSIALLPKQTVDWLIKFPDLYDQSSKLAHSNP